MVGSPGWSATKLRPAPGRTGPPAPPTATTRRATPTTRSSTAPASCSAGEPPPARPLGPADSHTRPPDGSPRRKKGRAPTPGARPFCLLTADRRYCDWLVVLGASSSSFLLLLRPAGRPGRRGSRISAGSSGPRRPRTGSRSCGRLCPARSSATIVWMRAAAGSCRRAFGRRRGEARLCSRRADRRPGS